MARNGFVYFESYQHEFVSFSSTEFYFKNNSCNRLSFIDSDGIVTGVKMFGRSDISVIAKKVEMPATKAL
jgi:hypothetical protein